MKTFTSLRDWLRHLAATDRLARIRDGVSLEYELAAIAKRLDGQQATFFPRPGGHAIPVVSGFVSRRDWIAEAMGVAQSELLARFSRAAAEPLPWREVASADAPCQQVRHDFADPNTDIRPLLPIPRQRARQRPLHHRRPRHRPQPETGVQNVSINRIQMNGRKPSRRADPARHLHAFFRAAEAKVQALDIAIAIGVDPLTALASQAIAPIDHDELEIAGALHGAPLAVVKCTTNEVRVPADAEIVIEGRLLANVREPRRPVRRVPEVLQRAGRPGSHRNRRRYASRRSCLPHRRAGRDGAPAASARSRARRPCSRT